MEAEIAPPLGVASSLSLLLLFRARGNDDEKHLSQILSTKMTRCLRRKQRQPESVVAYVCVCVFVFACRCFSLTLI